MFSVYLIFFCCKERWTVGRCPVGPTVVSLISPFPLRLEMNEFIVSLSFSGLCAISVIISRRRPPSVGCSKSPGAEFRGICTLDVMGVSRMGEFPRTLVMSIVGIYDVWRGPLVSVGILAALSSSGDQLHRRVKDEGGPMSVSQSEDTTPMASFLGSGMCCWRQ